MSVNIRGSSASVPRPPPRIFLAAAGFPVVCRPRHPGVAGASAGVQIHRVMRREQSCRPSSWRSPQSLNETRLASNPACGPGAPGHSAVGVSNAHPGASAPIPRPSPVSLRTMLRAPRWLVAVDPDALALHRRSEPEHWTSQARASEQPGMVRASDPAGFLAA